MTLGKTTALVTPIVLAALPILLSGAWLAGCGDGRNAKSRNRPPQAAPIDPVSVFPGDSAALLAAPVTDPDADPLSCAWSAAGLPDGLILPTGCAEPRVTVDRAIYAGGPADLEVPVTLSVTDGRATATYRLRVVILDERGGDVANTSSWEGTGYGEAGARHGHCGAPGHACATLEDAMANLRARIAGGDEVAPLLRLATTGAVYERDEALVLDDDAGASGVTLSLACGFDPVTWERPDGAWTRTPIRFSSATGVEITASGVRLDGCDIQAAEAAAAEPRRIAVRAHNAAVEVVDNLLVGAPEALAAPPEHAIGLEIVHDDPDTEAESLVEGNEINGGVALLQADGLDLRSGLARVVRNRIRGGRARFVAGMIVGTREGAGTRTEIAENPQLEGGAGTELSYALGYVYGDVWVHDNPEIVGCAAGCTSGYYFGIATPVLMQTFSVPLFERNGVFGVLGVHDAIEAVGMLSLGAVLSRDNLYQGGHAAVAIGVRSRGPLRSVRDTISGGDAFDRDITNPLDGVAIGMEISSRADLTDPQIVGAAADSTGSPTAAGVLLIPESSLEVTGGRIDGGPAITRSVGIDARAASGHLLVEEVAITGGDTAVGAGSSSVGLVATGIDLRWSDASAAGGRAEASTGLHLIGDNTVVLDGGTASGGGGDPATTTSRGVWLVGLSMFTRLTGLVATGGDACRSSYGLEIEGDVREVQLFGCEVTGGAGSLFSAGFFGTDAARSYWLEGNRFAGGGSSAAGTVRSVGLRLRATESEAVLANGSFVVGNLISAGVGTLSHGLELIGNAGNDIVVLHNHIRGGGADGAAGSVSGGVLITGDPTVANAHAGVLIGNLIDAGTGATAYGVHENCSMTGGLHRGEPDLAANNAFWPAVGGVGPAATAYVRKAPPDNCANATDITTIVAVNLLAYYGAGSASRASLADDPLLAADGVHLLPGSPLENASTMSDNYWPFANDLPPEAMLDWDGEARPCGASYDIGLDENCP